ncbi:MAG: hypothetical protein AB7H92_14140 [Microbacteriaceae bacterium]
MSRRLRVYVADRVEEPLFDRTQVLIATGAGDTLTTWTLNVVATADGAVGFELYDSSGNLLYPEILKGPDVAPAG